MSMNNSFECENGNIDSESRSRSPSNSNEPVNYNNTSPSKCTTDEESHVFDDKPSNGFEKDTNGAESKCDKIDHSGEDTYSRNSCERHSRSKSSSEKGTPSRSDSVVRKRSRSRQRIDVAGGSSKSHHREKDRSRSQERKRHYSRSSRDKRSRSRSQSKSRSRSRSSSHGRRRRSRSRRRYRRSRSRTPPEGARLHVAEIDVETRKRDLEKAFEKYGRLKEVWMARNPPCFAFIVFKHQKDAELAMRETDGMAIGHCRIRVTLARPRVRGGRFKGYDPNLRCYQCGEVGHFSRNCTDTKFGYKRPQTPPRSRRQRSGSHSRKIYRSRSRSRSRSRGRRSRSRSRDYRRSRSRS